MHNIIQVDEKHLKIIDKETLMDKLLDTCPGWLYRLYINYLSPASNIRRIRFFYQRHTRGFDDSETWSLDTEFFKWLAPRLKRLSELTCGWPSSDEYKTFEDWKKELDKRVKQCNMIIDIDEFDFKDHSYLTKETKAWIKKHKITSRSTINSFAKEECITDFMIWFSKNIRSLWW